MAKADYTKPFKILRLLRGIGNLEKLATQGDDTAHCVLADMNIALERSPYTRKQGEDLRLWLSGYTEQEIAAMRQVNQSVISRSILGGAKNISIFLEPGKIEKKFEEDSIKLPPGMPYYRGQNIKKKSKRVITSSVKDGEVEYEGQSYSLNKVTNTCSRCGSNNVEMSIFRFHRTGKLIKKWVCWNCEVSYDTVRGLGTKEGFLHE